MLSYFSTENCKSLLLSGWLSIFKHLSSHAIFLTQLFYHTTYSSVSANFEIVSSNASQFKSRLFFLLFKILRSPYRFFRVSRIYRSFSFYDWSRTRCTSAHFYLFSSYWVAWCHRSVIQLETCGWLSQYFCALLSLVYFVVQVFWCLMLSSLVLLVGVRALG
jgi:hypothetical protein